MSRCETLVETYTHRGCTIAVHMDDPSPDSPRNWANLGTMVCWHRNYNLGDEKPDYAADEWMKRLAAGQVGADEWDVIPDEHIARILEKHFIILPLYLYDHSGLSMSTGRFSCPWDSGQVGYIYITMEAARKEYPKLTDDKELKAQVVKMLEGEVEIYDQYLSGDVYGYVAIDWDGEDIDSCWGFYGYDETKENSHMVGEAKGCIDHYIDKVYPKTADQPGEVDAQFNLALNLA